jgi:hypothetical protein
MISKLEERTKPAPSPSLFTRTSVVRFHGRGSSHLHLLIVSTGLRKKEVKQELNSSIKSEVDTADMKFVP